MDIDLKDAPFEPLGAGYSIVGTDGHYQGVLVVAEEALAITPEHETAEAAAKEIALLFKSGMRAIYSIAVKQAAFERPEWADDYIWVAGWAADLTEGDRIKYPTQAGGDSNDPCFWGVLNSVKHDAVPPEPHMHHDPMIYGIYSCDTGDCGATCPGHHFRLPPMWPVWTGREKVPDDIRELVPEGDPT
jgi:hypothetical protein